MAGGVDLNFALSHDLLQGKNPGWWRDAKRVEVRDEVYRIVKIWYENPHQDVRVEDFVKTEIDVQSLSLADISSDELRYLIDDVLYARIGIYRYPRFQIK